MQRIVRQRRLETDRIERMSAAQFMAEEIDPLLEKISREGMDSLTRAERRKLEQAREKMTEEPGKLSPVRHSRPPSNGFPFPQKPRWFCAA